MKGAAVAVAVLCFYGLFYRRVVRYWGVVFGAIGDRLGRSSHRPLHEAQSLGRLLAAAVAQAGFAALLALAAGTDLVEMTTRFRPDLLALACVLGLAEQGASSALCAGIAGTAASVGPRGRDWVARQSRGVRSGWMGLFDRSTRADAGLVATAVIATYVAVEEVVFRGIVLDALRPHGALLAVGGSAVLFAVVQVFNMPSARAAVFPFVGGIVVGTVHGLVMWSLPELLPLVLAHLVFFLASLTRVQARSHEVAA